VRRRTFVGGLSAVAATAWTFSARAQQPKRIGALILGNADAEAFEKAMREGLAKAGYIDGVSVVLDVRSAQGRIDLLPGLASELVAAKVDVLVALYTPCARAAREATREIPIVAIIANPVETGFMASLARPGGNITGVSMMAAEAHGKCVEALRDTLPALRKVAALGNESDSFMPLFFERVYLSGKEAGVEIAPVTVRRPEEIAKAFETIIATGAGAVVMQGSLPSRIVAGLALTHRLAAASITRSFCEVGGLISYGPNAADSFQRGVNFVVKILRGANAAELPAEQPTKFELLLNLTTAKALGITVPLDVLAAAEELIG
jgi:putative ABC transport system substrate-binding protein